MSHPNTKNHWSCLFFLVLQGIIGTAFFSIFIPNIRLVFFAPVQAFVCIRTSFFLSVGISIICGFFLDCITTSLPFGIHTLLCSIIIFLLHGRKKHFFAEKMFSWVVYSSLISSLYAILIFVCMLLIQTPPPLSLRSIFSDIVIMAIIDGIYTLVWFKLPMYIMTRVKQLLLKVPSNEITLKS